MKKLILARYGGLSPVKQTHYRKNEEDMDYHTAPEKRGFYAFLYPYIDWFLLGGTDKLKEVENPKNKFERLTHSYRKFSVKGPIWTHLDIPPKFRGYILEEKGYWTKIDASILLKVLSANITAEKKYIKNISGMDSLKRVNIKNPFNFVSKDHLEIFVPKGTKVH